MAVYLHKRRDALRVATALAQSDPAPPMTLEKLRDDDRVVQDRIGSQAMIFLERHDEERRVRSSPEIASIETPQSRKNSRRSG